jgi:acylphosphatase
MSAGARFLVSGRVQGVSFRAATREQAQSLGLRGLARNLDDGRVEVIVQGEAAAIEALALWLQRGPPAAQVERLRRQAWLAALEEGFRIG